MEPSLNTFFPRQRVSGSTLQFATYQCDLLVGDPVLRQPRPLRSHRWRVSGVR